MVGIFQLGSNMVSAGALDCNCNGGVNCAAGCVLGAGSAFGNPCAIRTSGTGEHPGVVVPATTEEQLNTNPGTLPATAVTWNEPSESNAIPHPARTTVSRLLVGLQAMPTRGPR